jgi:DNA-binding FadR family transcriptional regulator
MKQEKRDHVLDLAHELEHAILAGEYQAGDRLPSERDLSERWGVSRSVVREALGRLASLGLVQSKHGSGTRVAAPSARPLELGLQRLLTRPDFRMEHLAQVRLPLETAIADQAARERSDEHLERLRRVQEILGDPRKPLHAHVQADVDFHGLLADATGNPVFAVVLAPVQKLLIESRRHTLGTFGAQLAHEHHAAILDAVARRDPAAAAAAMRRHLEINFHHLHEINDPRPTKHSR